VAYHSNAAQVELIKRFDGAGVGSVRCIECDYAFQAANAVMLRALLYCDVLSKTENANFGLLDRYLITFPLSLQKTHSDVLELHKGSHLFLARGDERVIQSTLTLTTVDGTQVAQAYLDSQRTMVLRYTVPEDGQYQLHFTIDKSTITKASECAIVFLEDGQRASIHHDFKIDTFQSLYIKSMLPLIEAQKKQFNLDPSYNLYRFTITEHANLAGSWAMTWGFVSTDTPNSALTKLAKGHHFVLAALPSAHPFVLALFKVNDDGTLIDADQQLPLASAATQNNSLCCKYIVKIAPEHLLIAIGLLTATDTPIPYLIASLDAQPL